MRKILVVIGIAVVVIVVLAFTWQDIPYLNTFLVDSGVVEQLTNIKTGILDTVGGNPTAMLGVFSALGGTIIALIRYTANTARQWGQEKQSIITSNQNVLGEVKALFSEEKEQLTTSITSLTDVKAELEEVIKGKDEAYNQLQDEVIGVQSELSKTQLELKEAIIQRDEYLIKVKELERATMH